MTRAELMQTTLLALTKQNVTGGGGGGPIIPVPDVIKQQHFESGPPDVFMIDESTLCVRWTATNTGAEGIVLQPWVTSVSVFAGWRGSVQYGACNANGVLPDIVGTGANRISYRNVGIPAVFTVSSGGGTNSIFISSVHLGSETFPNDRFYLVKL